MRFLLNTVISALIIASVAEIGKRSSFLAALLVALPLTSVLALSFLYLESRDIGKVAALSYGIFWMVLPTLLFFLSLPIFLKAGWNYWVALATSSTGLALIFFGYAWLLRKFGVEL